LNAYVDGALDPARRAEVAAYLVDHPDVAKRITSYARQRDELQAALNPVADEPVPPELNLANMIQARTRERPARRTGIPAWMRAAAALLFFAVGGAGGWSLHGMFGGESAGIPALAQEAADSYAVFAPDHMHPVEFRADDQAEFVTWASERLNSPVAVPDLTASGYRFMGGRLVATPHGPAVMFMYDDDHGTRLVMLTRLMAIDKNTRMSEHRHGGIAGFAWANKGIGYSLVGPVSPDVLHPLADEARRQIDRHA